MKTMLSIAGWAVATCGLTLAMLLPVGVTATSPAEELAARIANPKLVVNGCQLSLRAVGPTDAATPPSLELVAINTTDRQATVPWTVSMSETEDPGRESRSMPMPSEMWQDSGELSLKPGETKTVAIGKVLPTTKPSQDGLVLALDENRAQVQQQKRAVPQPTREQITRRARVMSYSIALRSGKQAIEPIAFGGRGADAVALNGAVVNLGSVNFTVANSVNATTQPTNINVALGNALRATLTNNTVPATQPANVNVSTLTINGGTLTLAGNNVAALPANVTISGGQLTVSAK